MLPDSFFLMDAVARFFGLKNHRTDLDTKPLEDLSTRLVMTVILVQVGIYLGY